MNHQCSPNIFANLLYHLLQPPPYFRPTHPVLLNQERRLTTVFPTNFHPGQDVSHYGDTGLPEPVKGLRRHLRAWRRRKDVRGSRFPSSTHPEGGASNRSVRGVMALQCARRCGSNHWRPETHGDKTGGGNRRPRPPATLQVKISRRRCTQFLLCFSRLRTGASHKRTPPIGKAAIIA